jgi:hypothetical protein
MCLDTGTIAISTTIFFTLLAHARGGGAGSFGTSLFLGRGGTFTVGWLVGCFTVSNLFL